MNQVDGPQLPPEVRSLFDAHVAEQLARRARGQTWRIDGPDSPRWVACPFCGVDAGELCDAQPGATVHGWHFARERANRARFPGVARAQAAADAIAEQERSVRRVRQ